MTLRLSAWLARMRAPYPPRPWREPRVWLKHALVDLSWRLARREVARHSTPDDEDVCCCGSYLSEGDYWACEGRCRPLAEWETQLVAEKWQRRLGVAPAPEGS